MRSSSDDFRVRAADDPASLLVLVLDVSALSWAQLTGGHGEGSAREGAVALESVTEQLLVFLNAYLLLHEANRACVILASPSGCHLAYPALLESDSISSKYDHDAEDSALDAGAGGDRLVQHAEQSALELRDAVVASVQKALRSQESSLMSASAPISTALAKALCLHNRTRRIAAARAALSAGNGVEETGDVGPTNGRILAVVAGRDSPEQYVPVMNCIFSAQRMGVAVDSCVLVRDCDSTYFQQAAHLTGGVCLRPEEFSSKETGSLIQFLQTVFLADRQSRDFLAMPTPEKVDFRASCMETRKIIDNGYTCSVCLSTFDLPVGKGAALCPVCSARFAVLPRAGRRPPRP